jgi:molybdenum cofactor cytidylyltransferase
MNSAAIILAAGSSSRMGRSKQMLDIKGEMLLVKTIQTVLKAGIPAVTVVLGAQEREHRNVIQDLPVDIVYNKRWERGMGSSLKSGLRHLLSKHPSLDAVIVLVCDQPLLASKNISALLKKYEETGKPLIASRYSQMPGVPALFGKSYFEKLARLPDEQGAKKIILQNSHDVIEVDFPGGEVDLDTIDDYNAFVKGKP